ncbi:MAG: RHS repeat-associated core domain-containing protein [Nitrososphaerales archaeon]
MKTAAAAIAILLLMLSSPFVGMAYAQTAPKQAVPSAPALPPGVPPPPTQAAPGTLISTNTWNRTQALACPSVKPPGKSPLVRETAPSLTLTSSVPTVLAGGTTASGPEITYTYTAYRNGTFSASDGQGNVLTLSPVTGYPGGQATVTLYGNSTGAVFLYTVGPLAAPTANFTVSYVLRPTTACAPGGVDVSIVGSVSDWPSPGTGKLRLSLQGQQVSANQTQVKFGGHDGMALVFDWSDTVPANPTAYQGLTRVVSWSVGPTFRIDPVIAGASTLQTIDWGDQRKLWHTTEANGTAEYWAAYFDGQGIDYAWSVTGITWHSGFLADTPSAVLSTGAAFSSWLGESDGAYTLYYALADVYSGGYVLGQARLGDNGAVNGGTPTLIRTQWSGDSYPCVYGTPTQVIVGIATNRTGSGDQLEVDTVNPATEQVLSKVFEPTGSVMDACIALGLTSGYAVIYGPATTTTAGAVTLMLGSNENWFSPETTPTASRVAMSSAVAVGNSIDFAAPTAAGEGFWSCTYPCATIGAAQTIASDPSGTTLDNVVLSTNARSGGSSITATYHDTTAAWSTTSLDGGKTWSQPQEVGASPVAIASGSLQGDYDYVSGPGGGATASADVAWVSGTKAPYMIWFPSFPVVVPSAATTSDPWAASGYSPYESYFSQLSEYVSPGNGLLGLSQTDATVQGRSPAIAVTRVYSEPSDFIGSDYPSTPYAHDAYTLSNLGDGWELGFPWIGGTAADPTFFHPGDGAAIPIAFNSSNVMEYHDGALNFVLYRNANNGTFTLYTADGTKYVYAGLRLSTVTSPSSPSDYLDFSYNASPGYITSITDSEGRSVAFSYNPNDTLASISAGGSTWRYTYHGADLSSVTDPLGRVTRYYYASFNPWLVSEVLYPTGAATYYTYDVALVAPYVSTYAVYGQYEYSSAATNTLTRYDAYSYDMVDGSMLSTQVAYVDGSTLLQQGSTTFDYSQVGSKTVQLEVQKDQSGNVLGEVQTTFDQHGRPNSTSVLSPKGVVLAYSVTHYDDWGNVNFTRDYDGHETWSAYANTQDQSEFGSGNTGLFQRFYTNSTIDSHIHTDLLGTGEFQDALNSANPAETFYLYDNGEVLRATQLYTPSLGVDEWLTTYYAYDALANLQTVTDPLGRQTCYAYSSTYLGAYVTSETTSGSSSCYAAPDVETAYTYDFYTGSVASETDPDGYTTSYTYDALGRLTSESLPAVNGTVATTRYSYNDATNVVTVTDPTGNITRDCYDGLGQLTEVQTFLSPTGAPYSGEYYTYNWQGQEATDQAPSGAVTTYSYDSLGRQVQVTDPDGSHILTAYNDTTDTETVTDGDGHRTQYVYDFMQNLLAVREYWSATTYNATTYTYDGVGNLVKTAGPDAGQVTTYTYDNLGDLVQTAYPDGTTQKATYDAVGDVLTSTDQMGRTTAYAYDFLDRLTAVHFPDGSSTTYTYDNDGNELTVDNAVDQITYRYDPLGDLLSETDVINGTQYRLSYSYDVAGDLQTMTYPDGTKVTSSYDALGRTTKVADASTAFASFTYNPDGTIATTTYGNGQQTKYSYDSMDRPTSIATSEGSTQQLDLTYKYDGAGNVLSIGSETYAYDPLERLAGSTGPWGTTSYSYDPAGNMVQEKSSTTTVKDAYNGMDELLRSVSSNGALTTYTYDNDGDLILKNDNGNIWVYQYDTQGQLVKVYDDGELVQTNLYDGDGRRIEQITGAGSTLYMYSGLDVVYEKNLQTGVATDHVYADGMQVASVTSSTVLFFHEDELGSTRLTSGSGGASVFSSDYMPYGVQYGASGSQSYMYVGMLYDSATGLYYDNARFYDPTTGRFLTEDPSGGDASDPQSLNGYTYARDDPLAIVDPTGMTWWNPLTWTPTQVFLGTVAIGLGIANLLQIGLDPLTDAGEAATVSELASSFAGNAAPEAATGIGPTSSDSIPLATQQEEDDFEAFEQAVRDQGPEAIGSYGQEVAKGYLEYLGLNFAEEVKFEGISDNGPIERYADFVLEKLGNLRNVAVEVKSGGPWTWSGELDQNTIDKQQLGDYLNALESGRFNGLLYINVQVGSHYGFDEGLQTALEYFQVAFKSL